MIVYTMRDNTDPQQDEADGGKTFRLRNDQIAALRNSIRKFNESPAVALRRVVIKTFIGTCGVLVFLFIAFGAWKLGIAMLAFALLAGLNYFGISGVFGRSQVFTKLIPLLLASGPRTYLIGGLAVVVLIGTLVLFDLLAVSVSIFIVGFALALVLCLTLDVQCETQRRDAIEPVEQMLNEARREGVDEKVFGHQVVLHGNRDWQPLYEALFSYKTMIEARESQAQDEFSKTGHHGTWRDQVVRWIDHRMRSYYATAQQPQPSAQTGAPSVASNAKNIAPHSPDHSTLRTEHEPAPVRERKPTAKPQIKTAFSDSFSKIPFRPLFNFMLGRIIRFMLGAGLIGGCLLWRYQNDLLPGQEIQELGQQIIEQRDGDIDQITSTLAAKLNVSEKSVPPLNLPWLADWLSRLLSSDRAGLAGLILIFSAIFRGPIIVWFVLPAAIIILFGHRTNMGCRDLANGYLSIVAGLALTAVGVCFQFLRGAAGTKAGLGNVKKRPITLLSARGEVIHRPRNAGKTLRVFRSILTKALAARASDIHFEPEPHGGVTRIRIDGVMMDLTSVDKQLFPRLLNLVKVLCELDITKHRIVQDGHFSALIGRREMDFRVSFTPAMHGQKLALRILDAANVPQHINELGLSDPMLKEIRTVCLHESGMLLVCGPPGSGKTTTLYAVLREIKFKQRNVITIEDPVEYQLNGITQMPVNEQAGNTFHALLRSGLRQDPDVILLGEIRDPDTARTALQAAITGHLVLATVHAKDTVTAILRLLDLGIEPNVLTSSLNLILAQRLVRTLCRHCKMADKPNQAERTMMDRQDQPTPKIFRPRGCSKCLNTGYLGRLALFELLVVDNVVKQAIQSSTISSLQEALDQTAFVKLSKMGWQAVADGVTTVEEVVRVTGEPRMGTDGHG